MYKKPDPNGHLLHDPIYMKYSESANPLRQKSRLAIDKDWRRGRNGDGDGVSFSCRNVLEVDSGDGCTALRIY